MTDDFEKYIEQTPIEILITHELFYRLEKEPKFNGFDEYLRRTYTRAEYWKITFQSTEINENGFYDFFGSKSPQNLFVVYKKINP